MGDLSTLRASETSSYGHTGDGGDLMLKKRRWCLEYGREGEGIKRAIAGWRKVWAGRDMVCLRRVGRAVIMRERNLIFMGVWFVDTVIAHQI